MGASVIALVTDDQASDASEALAKNIAAHVLDRAAFLNFVSKLEPSASNLANGQR